MENYVDWIGYLATFLAVISFTFRNVTTLRIVNTCAAITFTVYGSLISAMPVILTNVIIGSINVYHLLKMQKQ